MTLEDVGDYRILVKAKQTITDLKPVKKYLFIFITDQIDDADRTELSFETALSPFDILIGQSPEKILPSIKEGLNGLRAVRIEPDEKFVGSLNYSATRGSVKYLP